MSISTAEYNRRNLSGFEGDRYMKSKFIEIVKRKKIDIIIETGTYKGGTTNQLRQIVPKVITIEANREYYEEAKQNIEDHSNVSMLLGDSSVVLADVLSSENITTKKLMFFLDAHWHDACPLKDELQTIANAGLKPIIVIHDWVVPGTGFGFDSYNGQPFTWEWIEKDIFNIYGENFIKYYNVMAEGAKRGVLYIEPR
jgi:predicted O-methyltransferase YrrM